MKLNLRFDPSETPERQPQLRIIPPAVLVDHPEIGAKLGRYEQAIADEREARDAYSAAEEGLPAARRADQVALADARETGGKDPGAANEKKQQAALADAERQLGASRVMLERAVQGIVDAFDEHGDAYESALRQERERTRAMMSDLLDQWLELHGDLQRNEVALNIGQVHVSGRFGVRPAQVQKLTHVAASGGNPPIQIAAVMDALRNVGAEPEPEPEREPANHRRHPGQSSLRRERVLELPGVVTRDGRVLEGVPVHFPSGAGDDD
jgi:hypothetical protein